jgi:hypothetical protein
MPRGGGTPKPAIRDRRTAIQPITNIVKRCMPEVKITGVPELNQPSLLGCNTKTSCVAGCEPCLYNPYAAGAAVVLAVTAAARFEALLFN